MSTPKVAIMVDREDGEVYTIHSDTEVDVLVIYTSLPADSDGMEVALDPGSQTTKVYMEEWGITHPIKSRLNYLYELYTQYKSKRRGG